MINPKRITKENLKEYLEKMDKDFTSIFVSGSSLNPNPRLYKYYWWIYSMESKENSAYDIFYKKEYRLSTKEFNNEIKRLQENNISFTYVNQKLHRLGSIFNYHKLKEKYPNIEFALSFDEDSDELVAEYK